jgi:hypothetical protein
MKYKIIGANRDTGARQVVEFEAESKGAAERKATQMGMSVTRVEDITDGHVAHATPGRSSQGRGAGSSKFMPALVVIILLAAAAYYLFKIRHVLGH